MKNLFTLLTCIFMLAIKPEAQAQVSNSPVQQTIHGCWYNPDTQEWLLGFFENFAIYEDDIWLYQSMNIRKGKAEITLGKGNESRMIKLKFDNK
jgi:hypothetical protein